jgi:hypothetical protein
MIRLPHFAQDLPQAIKGRLGQKGVGKQRAMIADGHLLLVLHRPPQPGTREREGAFFWRKPDGAWIAVQGEGLTRLGQHLDEFEKVEATLSQDYSRAQNAEDYFRILEQAAALLHTTKSLHATLQAAREGIPQDRNLIDVRDRAYDLERTMDLLYTHTKNALDFQLARQSENQSRISAQSVNLANRLNVLAAVFFPLMALSGVFGMNLSSALEQASGGAFWMVLIAGIFLGFVLCWWVLRGIPVRSLLYGAPQAGPAKSPPSIPRQPLQPPRRP